VRLTYVEQGQLVKRKVHFGTNMTSSKAMSFPLERPGPHDGPACWDRCACPTLRAVR